MSIANNEALFMPLDELTPVDWTDGAPLEHWTDNIKVGDRVLRVHEIWYEDISYSQSRKVIKISKVFTSPSPYIVDADTEFGHHEAWGTDVPFKGINQRVSYYLMEDER